LVTNQGYALLDTNDELIEIEGEFTVDKKGAISVNGEFLTNLKLVKFEDQQLLVKEGDLLNSSGQTYTFADSPGILQGQQESSNVNAVKEMITLISTTRAYESCQKVVLAEDETLGIAINEVGSVV
jgi:flagellar basal-body rod protein FlgG